MGDRLMRSSLMVLITAAASIALTAAAHAELLKREPPMGKLKQGQRVLVDDGRCPAGQVSEVVGGNHVKAGGTQQVERTRRCVARR
jgi:hypothetical protein